MQTSNKSDRVQWTNRFIHNLTRESADLDIVFVVTIYNLKFNPPARVQNCIMQLRKQSSIGFPTEEINHG